MRFFPILTCSILVSAVIGAGLEGAAAQVNKRVRRVLYFTKSSGYEHSVVKREGDRLSHSERILTTLLANYGIEIVCTKDGGVITKENLRKFDTVIFFTSGNLLEPGTDGTPPISEQGMADLLEWIRNGGGFIGFHAATDSMRGEKPTEYTKMIGGLFLTHGQQTFATVRVVDPNFPAMAGLPAKFLMKDEWYVHTQVNVNRTMHVLALLETKTIDQEKYNQFETIPIIWCSNYGKGRVFYNAMGHREDVWEMPLFQGMVLRALDWTMGDVEGDASPNFKEFLKEE